MVDMRDDAEDQPLGYLLYRVASALRAEVTATALEPLGLTFPQYLCMRVLSRFPGRSNAELARDMSVSPQAMNTVVRGLQDRGLVTRPATVASGRSLPAQLTREGAELLDRTDSGVAAAEQRLMSGIDSRQRADFRRILAVLGSA
jgi:DNA-binding MarR family transcriptional regulator